MTDLITVDAPAEGEWPTFDTAHLLRRIGKLDAEAQDRLRESWAANHLPGVPPLATAEQYQAMERLVDTVEPHATDIGPRLQWVLGQLGTLPPVVYDSAVEAIATYAGTRALSATHPLLTSEGRLLEMERITAEAVAYAATLATIPSVTELPEVPQVPGPEASNDHPGPKAKAGEVVAWVGQDRNRAARAWLHEHDRPKPRSGVVDKLRAVLGAEGVLAVEAEIAKHQPPPLDLGGVPGTSGTGDDSSSPSAGGSSFPPADGDAPEAAATADDGAEAVVEPPVFTHGTGEGSTAAESDDDSVRIYVVPSTPQDRIADALERIATALEARA